MIKTVVFSFDLFDWNFLMSFLSFCARFLSLVASLILIELGFSSSVAVAQITATGDVAPTYDGTDPWTVSGVLSIGNADSGSLTIAGGSVVNSDSVEINEINSQATITGAGSQWNIEESTSLFTNLDFEVLDGAHVNTGSFSSIGDSNIRISGQGSRLTTDSVSFQATNASNNWTVDDGATMLIEAFGFSFFGTDGSSLTISGADTRVETRSLDLGNDQLFVNLDDGAYLKTGEFGFQDVSNSSGIGGTLNISGGVMEVDGIVGLSLIHI